MGYREIKPEDMDIFEDRAISPVMRKKKFSLEGIQISTQDMYEYLIYGLVGLFLIYVGCTNAGSYYALGTRLSGPLGTLFYTWDFGTVLTVTGCFVIYHRFFGAGRR